MNIVITGANGLVATELTHLLLHRGLYEIYLVSTNLDSIKQKYAGLKNVKCYNIDTLPHDLIDCIVVHTAFARNGKGNDFIESIAYLNKVLDWAKKTKVDRFFNLSSQSVYGSANPPMWKENYTLQPTYLYALAKAISEQIVEHTLSETPIKWTNIRLASISRNARFINIFVQNAINNIPITVQGGDQICSFIDIRDVATGILSMIEYQGHYDKVYNLGAGLQHSIMQIANITKEIGQKYYGFDIKIEFKQDNTSQNVGMNIDKFCNTFNWTPKFGMSDMISQLYEMNLFQH